LSFLYNLPDINTKRTRNGHRSSPADVMGPERWERIKALAESAFERQPDQRSAYLAEACCGDKALRAEVEDLISRHQEASTASTPRFSARTSDKEPHLAEFSGTERFRLEQRLGAGAFGVVYRAYDRKRQRVVALKTLTTATPEALYRLKCEFRSLTDLSHPNLVRLYELISQGSAWFITMELVDGVTFLEFVRPRGGGPSTVLDEGRLRSSLGQLVDGVIALHQAGRLHRDLKPSNVLVSRDGCVRILDFGLVLDFSLPGARQSSRIVGTPAYMAPEQGRREPVSEASDWYSVGVMLYEALTGRLPFRGAFLEILMQKQSAPPPLPSDARPGVPPDLDELCGRLLQPDPSARPTGREILPRLRCEARATRPTPAPSTPLPGAPFVGRQEELRELQRAFVDVQAGHPGVVALHGTSGIGKSSLVRVFLEGLARSAPATVILNARCYEQESVPYKALDGIVDSLAAFVRRLPDPEADSLLPRDVVALARLFPVLKQVPAILSARRHVLQVVDSQELRRRAFGALRELLIRLGEQRALVMFIDDLQWGDVDSAELLSEVLRPPDPPCLLLVGAYRTEEIDTSPFLRHILPLRARAVSAIRFRELALSEIDAAQAIDLAQLLLGSNPSASADQAATIARGSGGNPFLLSELARHAQARWGRRVTDGQSVSVPPGHSLGFEEVIRTRVEALPEPARRLLEAVCVAGQPVDEALAHRVAELPEGDAASVDLLKDDRFVRSRLVGDSSRLEAYHDRIREAVVRSIPSPTLRSYHATLGRELERDGQADPETLALHFEAGDEPARAADHAIKAGERASEALAFDHAARLYHKALRLRSAHPQTHRLRVLLADSLASAGRGEEAAGQYLQAVKSAHGVEAQDLRRRAAQQLLTSGHIQAGLEVLEALLRAVGMSMPRSRWRALASIVWYRLLLRLRGIRFRARSESEIPADHLVRVDTCWSVTVGLTFVEPLVGWAFQSQHVLLALRAGEPYRVARALAVDAGFMASSGGTKARPHVDELLQRARALSDQISNPHALALTTFAEGFAAYFGGAWTRALEQLRASESMFRERCTGVAWELNASQLYALRCLYYLGRARDIQAKLGTLLDDVGRRGDLFLEAALRTTFLTYLALSRDEPERAAEELERVSALGLHKRFMLQHFWELEARVLLALYTGNGGAAFGILRQYAREFRRSELGRLQQNRIFACFWRGRSALAAARTADSRTRRRLLQQADRDAAAIQSQGVIWGNGFAQLLRAGLAIAGDRREAALEHLRASQASFEAGDVMGAAAIAARFRCGELTAGGEGSRMTEQARAWFKDQGFARPERFVDVYIP
jgi:hypothetical protein